MSRLRDRMARVAAAERTIPPRAPDRPVPLTRAQRRLWFLDRAGLDGAAYLCSLAHRLRGPLDVARLRDALDAVAARHEALRTCFTELESGEPVQIVHDRVRVPFEREGSVESFLSRPFDLAAAPLMRALLVRLGDDDHVLALSLHHLVCDGESARVLFEEIYALYRGDSLPEPGAQFGDYAVWVEGRAAFANERAYWTAQLEGAPALLELPTDRTRPPRQSGTGARYTLPHPPDVRKIADRAGSTAFMVTLTALAVALGRVCGTEDVVIGTPAADRDRAELDRAVGLYVNSLALRIRLDGDPTLADVLARVTETTLAGLDHRLLPYDEVVELAGGRRDLSHNPLFQVMLVMGEAGGEIAVAPGLSAEGWPVPPPPARLDLTVVAEPHALHVDYAEDLFDEESVAVLAGHVVAVLEALATAPGTRAGRVASAVPPPPGVEPSPEPAVITLIAARAAEAPGAPAVITPEGVLTYGELLRRADRLAAHLPPPGGVVGIALTGADAITAIVGVMRAGHAYLPLDPAHPAERLRALLDEAGAVALVGDDVPGFQRPVVPATAMDVDRAPEWGGPVHSDLAYVVFTSGSTGRPKGVMVGHRSLARLSAAFVQAHGFGPGQRILMVPPLTFDASVGDVFPALTSGAALVLHPEPVSIDAAELVGFCTAHGVTAVDTAASLWRAWTAGLTEVPDDWPVTTMMVGGEPVPASAVRDWHRVTRGRTTLVNHYGPTEATVCVTLLAAPPGAPISGQALPIGTELPHVRAYVLDARGEPVPDGGYGELHLGGDCLARGYLGRPELTAERFVPDPYGRPGARMYRTGDRVRRGADGNLHFAGRFDRQLKVRGHRIEPAEVEAALTACAGVTDAAVMAAGERLAAYVAGEVSGPSVRRELRERLPAHLVPDVIVAVPAIARTSHGKVDAERLPPLDARAAHEAPRGPLERELAGIWADATGASEVGRHDNFFAVGGHSLLAAGVLAAVRRRLGVTLPVSALFETADLAELAELVAGTATPGGPLDLRAEVRLPQGVAFTARRAGTGSARVLLTGGTGFLGAHLLQRLAERGRVACLVRASSPEAGMGRIREGLRAYGLSPSLSGVEAVPGDLAAPRFGLAEPEFAELAGAVDVIVHNGGLINFAQPYHLLRPVNVGGTAEVLRLAALGGGTPLHHISTLGVYLGGGYLNTRVTEDDAPADPGGLDGGYNQSKWVADRLVSAARERGLPVSVHRPARIGGNPGDYFSRLLATCVRLGMVPALPYAEDVSPVDHVAAAVAALAHEPAGDDYHYFNPRMIGYPELAEATGARLVPWAQWRGAVHARLADLPLAPFVAALPESAPVFERPDFDCSRTERRLAALGLPPCPPADPALIRRYLETL